MRNFCIKRSDGVLARIVAHPTGGAFDHYVVVEEAGKVRFKLWVYTLDVCELGLFKAKWKTDNELVITIPSQQAEISVYVNECKATMRGMTKRFLSPLELSSRRNVAGPYLAM